MGIPIARNLAFKARSAMYLQLHSRDSKKLKMVSEAISTDGATCAMRLHHRYRTMTKWCDIILLTLANRRAAARVLLEDEEALIPCARPGQIIVDHTTVDVALSRTCGIEAEKRGAIFLDAPMSGSPRAVFNNQLVLMIGGPAEYYQRLLPIFRLYADHIHHMGNHGSGTATKLVSQALVASHNAAAAEAMTMANRLGIEDHRRLVQVLDASWGSSTMLRRNAGTMQDAIRSPDAVPPTSHASIDHLLEDLSLLDDSLPEPDVHKRSPPLRHAGKALPSLHASSSIVDEDGKERFPVLDASLRMLGAAQETGMGSRDLSAVVHFIQAAAVMEQSVATVTSHGLPSSLSVDKDHEAQTRQRTSSWDIGKGVEKEETSPLYPEEHHLPMEEEAMGLEGGSGLEVCHTRDKDQRDRVEDRSLSSHTKGASPTKSEHESGSRTREEEMWKWNPATSHHGRLPDERPPSAFSPGVVRASPPSGNKKGRGDEIDEEEFY